MNNKLIVALDFSHRKDALKIVEELRESVEVFKVGIQLFTSCGPKIIQEIKERKANIFLDLKFFDIPNTVEKASEAATALDVDFFDLHLTGGREMIEAAITGSERRAMLLGKNRPKILGVTVLTSQSSAISEVVNSSTIAKENGLDGVIASGLEVAEIRKRVGKDFLILCPGIRPSWAKKQEDQKRIVSPKEAIENGASYIIVGRPITAAKNPREATKRILKEIE
ncbi:MAG: orotidine-5'-phosphate decarboxylase [Candidatus Omnitrophica bacterium]|nr:orotidine-5'-phosphate decarboxylase [Candidatus Omnitrophota bacterium]